MTITISPSDLLRIRIALADVSLARSNEGLNISSKVLLDLRSKFDVFVSILDNLSLNDFFDSSLVSITLAHETK